MTWQVIPIFTNVRTKQVLIIKPSPTTNLIEESLSGQLSYNQIYGSLMIPMTCHSYLRQSGDLKRIVALNLPAQHCMLPSYYGKATSSGCAQSMYGKPICMRVYKDLWCYKFYAARLLFSFVSSPFFFFLTLYKRIKSSLWGLYNHAN